MKNKHRKGGKSKGLILEDEGFSGSWNSFLEGMRYLI
jgi:hypothetical protein